MPMGKKRQDEEKISGRSGRPFNILEDERQHWDEVENYMDRLEK